MPTKLIHRRYQFGLKAFLCAAVVAGLLFAVVAYELARRSTSTRIVEMVVENGGVVEHLPAKSSVFYTSTPSESKLRRALASLTGDRNFCQIRSVWLGSTTDNRQLEMLKQVQSICDVALIAATFTTEMAQTIIAQPNIHGVMLTQCTYSDEAIRVLAGSPNIERISLWPDLSKRISLAPLQKSSIRVLSVGHATIDASELATVIQTTPVMMLHLDSCTIERIDALHDAASTTLTSIHLRDTDLGSLDASWIDQYPRLRNLQLLDCMWENDQKISRERRDQLNDVYIGTTRTP